MPIAAVCVTNGKGALVGKTDNDGLLKDTKDFDKLYFSHMAFQSKCVNLDTLSTDRIVLEDANYNLGEIDVKPKELIYVQNYTASLMFAMMVPFISAQELLTTLSKPPQKKSHLNRETFPAPRMV